VNTVNTSLSKIEQTDRQKAGQDGTGWGVGVEEIGDQILIAEKE
jgi:hypothetical protein